LFKLTIMNITAEQLVSEALNMPRSIRAFVAERIIESLDIDADSELSPEWKIELTKRCQELDQKSVPLHDSEDVFKRAYAKLS